MLDKLFLEILNMSFTASIVIVMIMLVRLLLKKLPKLYTYMLWLIVLIRLICPFSIESILSLMPVNSKPISTEILYTGEPVVHTGMTVVDQLVNQSLPVAHVEASVNPLQIWILIGELIWIIGMVGLLGYGLITLIMLKRKLHTSEYEPQYSHLVTTGRNKVRSSVYVTEGIHTPFVLGIFKPNIYLPLGIAEEETSYILLHEQIHIKRGDHILRLLSFFLLCAHWFNPFIWLAFFLAGKDMEMSCDEAVVRELGTSIKKSYSTSLLTFAIGRNHTGLIPLAFGESSTKSRVKNILNYKKPSFWIVVLILVAGVTLGVGLLTNPVKQIAEKEKELPSIDGRPVNTTLTIPTESIEACANLYMEEVLKDYGKLTSFKIIDSKIIVLNKLAGFDSLMNNVVELWAIEYRLKPDNVNNVILTDGTMEDGWITEEGDMGKPILVIENRDGQYSLLGEIRSGYLGTTVSGQEIAARTLLEEKGFISKETYEGPHIMVKFPLSTGETCKLLLSQPTKKGEGGIWCVERWMDGGGNIYYDDLGVDTTLIAYYEELQKAYDKGERSELVDTKNVALKYTNKVLGQMLTYKDLELIEDTSLAQFYELPVSTYIGYISDFDLDTDVFHLDRVEWITSEQVERMKELGLSEEDMPNGFYIYNPKSYSETFILSEMITQYTFLKYNEASGKVEEYTTREKKEFYNYLKEKKSDNSPVFWVETIGEHVSAIREQYIP